MAISCSGTIVSNTFEWNCPGDLKTFFPPKSGDVVSMNYPFYIGRNHIFQVKIWAKEKRWKLEVQASERASVRNGQRLTQTDKDDDDNNNTWSRMSLESGTQYESTGTVS
jgi:hypothetical protein